MSVSAANVRRRLTKDSVGELMHGPPKPKFLYDHHAANLRKLGELARDVSARREEEAAPAPQPFKLSRFAHVESRLAQTGVRCWARGARGRAAECAHSPAGRALRRIAHTCSPSPPSSLSPHCPPPPISPPLFRALAPSPTRYTPRPSPPRSARSLQAMTRSPPKSQGGRPASGAGSDPTHSPGGDSAEAGAEGEGEEEYDGGRGGGGRGGLVGGAAEEDHRDGRRHR